MVTRLTSCFVYRLVSTGEALSSRIAKDGMRRVMLEAVACGLANTPREIRRYVGRTLLAALNDFQDVVARDATDALGWLRCGGFTVWDQHAFRWEASALGRAASAAHLTPDAAVRVVNDVRRARRRLILESDLHLLFLCVEPEPEPAATRRETKGGGTENGGGIDNGGGTNGGGTKGAPREPETCWLDEQNFIKIYGSLSEHEGRVANAVGIKADYVEGRMRSGRKDTTAEHKLQRRVCLRFLHALALKDLVSEVDQSTIVTSFGLKSSARLTQLQESAGRYAGQVAAVCGPMGWGDMEVLVARLQDRITAGAREDILCLTSIAQVGTSRARTLYNHGVRTPEAIASLSREDLVKILATRGPFERAPGRAADAILRGARQLCEEQRNATREESEAKLRELEKLAPIDDKENVRDEDAEGKTTDGETGEGDDPTLDVDAARGCVVVRHPRRRGGTGRTRRPPTVSRSASRPTRARRSTSPSYPPACTRRRLRNGPAGSRGASCATCSGRRRARGRRRLISSLSSARWERRTERTERLLLPLLLLLLPGLPSA